MTRTLISVKKALRRKKGGKRKRTREIFSIKLGR